MDRWERRQLRRLLASMVYHLTWCLLLGAAFTFAFAIPPKEPLVMVITASVALLCPVGMVLSAVHLIELVREFRSRLRR